MTERTPASDLLKDLNPQQRQAVEHGDAPLLIIAGAGTGKTCTLVHRVAYRILQGVPPARMLLLTFTRRAAAEMLRRVDGLLRDLERSRHARFAALPASRAVWGGTFHATASRLLRTYGQAIGLTPDFTILDRGDAEDLLDVVRTELGLAQTNKRFPRKSTCLAIYSHCVNALQPIEDVLAAHYPWCQDYHDELKQLFRAYGDRKELGALLDYDDLLLFWRGLLADEHVGRELRSRFECVLVDEYQDTNRVQAEILRLLRPDGVGLTVVGDDAQSIYAFRAATVRNILDFPQEYPGTTIVKLEQNYRSTQPILAATNRVIAQARERYTKDLWTARSGGEPPALVSCQDENEQADFLVREILKHREDGVDLRKQAVLYRASHHSIVLEGELTRHNIPYVKFGGLKFLEAAHIKDLLAFLRLAENPRDLVAGTRVLQLLPGVGPKRARKLMDALIESGGDFSSWAQLPPLSGDEPQCARLPDLMRRLTARPPGPLAAQIHQVRDFYDPILRDKYDHAEPRRRDLEQLEQLASRFADRQTLLTELALDPPDATEDFAGDPHLDEDYLILSTIHSAKGLEWDVVYLIHAADGNIPADLATRNAEELEEELRLFYVALTRARNRLAVCYPLRYYHAARGAFSDRHSYAQLTRFISADVQPCFQTTTARIAEAAADPAPVAPVTTTRHIRSGIQALWS
jgi:DNA helicase II / ATP-dependent DNA helicase PcrA